MLGVKFDLGRTLDAPNLTISDCA